MCQVLQREKQLRTASRNAVYSEILEKHLHHAHETTEADPSERIHRAQSVSNTSAFHLSNDAGSLTLNVSLSRVQKSCGRSPLALQVKTIPRAH